MECVHLCMRELALQQRFVSHAEWTVTKPIAGNCKQWCIPLNARPFHTQLRVKRLIEQGTELVAKLEYKLNVQQLFIIRNVSMGHNFQIEQAPFNTCGTELLIHSERFQAMQHFVHHMVLHK
jgi:hypothetical protein